MLLSLLKVAGITLLTPLAVLRSVDSSVVHTDLSAEKGVNKKLADINYDSANFVMNNTYRLKLEEDLPTDLVYEDRFSFNAVFDVYTNDFAPVLLYENCSTCTFSSFTSTSPLMYFMVNDGQQRSLFYFQTDGDTYSFTSTSSLFLVFKSDFDFSGQYSYGDSSLFFNLFQEENYQFRFNQRMNSGALIGSGNLISTNSNNLIGDNVFFDGVFHTYLDMVNLYKFAQGLFYEPRSKRYYSSFAYSVVGVGNSKVSLNGNVVDTSPNTIMVSGLYLANYMDNDYEVYSGSSSDILLVGWLTTTYDENDVIIGSYYTFRYNDFVCIGDSLYDVEYVNLASDTNLFSDTLHNINLAPNSLISFDSIVDSNGSLTVDSTNLLTNTFNLMGEGIGRLFGFLNIMILPGISIGTIIFIPFAITIMIFVLKIFKR